MRRRYQNHLETDVGSYSGDTAKAGPKGQERKFNLSGKRTEL